jgi:DNA-binding HxlR family transcriptional regulator
MDDVDFVIFLRMLSKKGFLDTLLLINNKKQLHYNELQKYLMMKKIVTSQASVTIILNGLTNLGLLERTVVDGKPPRTSYSISKSGKTVLAQLNNLKKSL